MLITCQINQGKTRWAEQKHLHLYTKRRFTNTIYCPESLFCLKIMILPIALAGAIWLTEKRCDRNSFLHNKIRPCFFSATPDRGKLSRPPFTWPVFPVCYAKGGFCSTHYFAGIDDYREFAGVRAACAEWSFVVYRRQNSSHKSLFNKSL